MDNLTFLEAERIDGKITPEIEPRKVAELVATAI
jgi:hypothetical protein